MREACRITAGARTVARQAIAAGVTTREIDREVHKFILRSGATPVLPQLRRLSGQRLHLGERGSRTRHPGREDRSEEATSSAWTWVRRIHGFTGDCAGTLPCGEISEEAKRLIEVTRQSFFEGIKFARPGYRVSDIGHAIQEYVESHGFSVVREYEGHGVGAKLHEDPEIPTSARRATARDW